MCCICMEVGRDCCADIMEHVFNTDICFWHLSWVILYIFKWVWALMTTFKLVFMFFLGLGKEKKMFSLVFFTSEVSHQLLFQQQSYTVLSQHSDMSWFPGSGQILLSVAPMKWWWNADPGDETLELWRAVLICGYCDVVFTWIALTAVYFFQLCSKTLLLWLA